MGKKRFEDLKDVGYKNQRQIVIDRVMKMMMEWEPREAFEFVCSFPELFEVLKPVQDGSKFTYTIRIRDGV